MLPRRVVEFVRSILLAIMLQLETIWSQGGLLNPHTHNCKIRNDGVSALSGFLRSQIAATVVNRVGVSVVSLHIK